MVTLPRYPTGVPERQLHLFALPKPLLERFGGDFFRKVPRVPGVYIMTGRGERVLYIGQSGNLRKRLASYKNALPDCASRKTVRLVRLVERISWETCRSAVEARLRENELLRLHRPRFNRLNTYPGAYSFICLRGSGGGVELCRARAPVSEAEAYGAFKSHVLSGYGALLRLSWAALKSPASPLALPRQLLAVRPPGCFTLRVGDADLEGMLVGLIRGFLAGSSDAICEWLSARVSTSASLDHFSRAFYGENLNALKLFYNSGPRRNRQLATANNLPGGTIAQPLLDDLLVLGPNG